MEKINSNQFVSKDEINKNRSDIKDFFELLHFAKDQRKRFFFSFSILITASVFAILAAKGIGDFVEKGLSAKNLKFSIIFGSMVLIFELIRILCIWQGRKMLAKASSFSILSIRKTIFGHIHELPLSYYDHQPQGRTVTRMTHDVESLEEFFVGGLGRFINLIFMVIMSLVGMLMISFKMGAVVILGVVPVIILTLVSRNRIKNINRKMSKRNSATNAKLSEYLNGMQIIRTFGLESHSQKKYDDIVNSHLESCLDANTFYGFMRPIISFLSMIPLGILLVWGGYQVANGFFEIGVFVTFIRLCDNFSRPIVDIMREIHLVQQAFTSSERVMTFLKAEKEDIVIGKDGKLIPSNIKGDVIFKNVFMSYDNGKSVLKNINFNVNAGEKIGLVGPTGSGKTTTVSLLSRLYGHTGGDIYLDGTSITDFKRLELRRIIGAVSQDVVLFSGTVRENLTLDLDIDDQTILDCCKKTSFYNVLSKNKLNLDSPILDKGENLSTGEKQLLSFTRILLRNPPLLILDEASANIDEKNEVMIQSAIDEVMKNRTCFIVAHRLNTLKKCDRIFIFDEGKIISEKKNHEWKDLDQYMLLERWK